MVAFFAGLIIIGISLILISIIMVMFDRKRDIDEKNEVISIKNELRELLEDSNEMVDELNRFSDYVVTKVDEKCSEYMNLIKSVPETREETSKVAETDERYSSLEKSDVEESIPVNLLTEDSLNDEIIKDEIHFSEDVMPLSSMAENKNNGMNSKHSEVIKLFEAGMSDGEIAKALNMGKGEVQLIVGLNLHKIKV